MTDDTVSMPTLGEAGESCRSCGSALAADQRYCLECGTRRAAPRVAFGEHLHTTERTTVATPPVSRASRANAALAAGIGCLLLAMGVGVLIGRSGEPEAPRAAAAPQVIRVGSGDAVAGDEVATDAASSTAKKTKKKKKSSSDDEESAPSAAASKATNPALKKLDNLSPKEFQKQSQKLPKTLGTGGKPPPKDKKKPAGGGGFEEIG